MRRGRWRSGTAVAVCLGLGCSGAMFGVGRAAADSKASHPAALYPQLWDVASLPDGRAFTSGDVRLGREPLLEQWDGSRWSRLPHPAALARSSISPLAAVSDDDLWAVGQLFQSHGEISHPWVGDWDGQSWRRTPLPGPTLNTDIEDATALSATDVWLTGDRITNDHGGLRPVTYHWNGTVWTSVGLPFPGRGRVTDLIGTSGIASDDVWAVGGTVNRTGDRDPQTYVVHWDGTSWSRVSTPNPGSEDNRLLSVTAITPSNVWGVGETGSRGQPHTLLEHDMHGTWHVVRLPPAFHSYTFRAIAVDRPDDVWLVGFTGNGAGFDTVAVHWNGHHWRRTPTPNPGGDTYLTAVSANGPGATWAVGVSNARDTRQQVRLLWDGHSWSRQ
jgi:hypothetical protein